MSNINAILDKLDKVKKKPNGEWLACCPVHDDKTPSLSLWIKEDNSIRIHCHACGADGLKVLESIGGDQSWLFPEKKTAHISTPVPKKDNSALANELYGLGSDDCSEHPYIIAKGIKSPLGARRLKINGKRLLIGVPVDVDALIIPIYAGNNPKISSLQIIWKSGDKFEKRFLKDGYKELGWFAYGNKWSKAEKIVICEGLATGQSIIECTGLVVICAYSSGELPKVYDFVRSVNVSAQIYIAVDADKAGREAATKCKGAILVEPVSAPDKFDWNDEHKRGGTSVVAAAFENAKPAIDPVFNSILDSDFSEEIDLLSHVPENHIFHRLVKYAAHESKIPVNTTFLLGLGAFSAMSVRKYRVHYQNSKEFLPIGLYVVGEQPSGAGKGRVMRHFVNPFFAAKKKAQIANLRRIEQLEELSKDDIEPHERAELKVRQKWSSILFLSNTTAEGLELTLNESKGFFGLFATEKGLINTILGISYSNGKAVTNNNDIVLNGFDGGYVAGSRVNRPSYIGNVCGAFVSLAQRGSIDSIFSSSDGTGYSERFFIMSEPSNIGHRKRRDKPKYDEGIFLDYDKSCLFAFDVLFNPVEIQELESLCISDAAHGYIDDFMDSLEPYYLPGKKYDNEIMRGCGNKADIQVMKIASNLFLMGKKDWDGVTIGDDYVIMAIRIVNDLLKVIYYYCKNKGLIGERADFQEILSLFDKKPAGMVWRDIQQAKKHCVLFKKDEKKSTSEKIKAVVDEMVKQNILKIQVDTRVNREIYIVA